MSHPLPESLFFPPKILSLLGGPLQRLHEVQLVTYLKDPEDIIGETKGFALGSGTQW